MERAEVEALRRRISEKVGAGTPAALAIEREQWELAAMHLLLGALELRNELGAARLDALLDELDAGLGPHRGSRAREKRNER